MKSLFAFLLSLLLSGPAFGEGQPATVSDWGGAGLLLTPNARFQPEGTVVSGFTTLGRIQRNLAVSYTPVPWLELTARQTIFPGRGRIAEPGLDVKVRLLKESAILPALTIGGRDVTGSGLALPGSGRFAGEYLVASRRWWSVDATLGLGWGRLGERGSFINPMGMFGSHFRSRSSADPQRRGPETWFTGRDVAVIGGLEWHTPIDNLSLKLEYAGDGFDAEQRDTPSFKPGRPVNVGLSWRPLSWLDLGAGFEQGRRAMLRLSVPLGPTRTAAPDTAPAAPPAFKSPSPGTPDDTRQLLAINGIQARSLAMDENRAVAWIDAPPDGSLSRDAGRAARILAARADPGVEEVTVVAGRNGSGETSLTLSRGAILSLMEGRGSAEEAARDARIGPPDAAPPFWTTGWSLSSTTVTEQSLFEHTTPSVYRVYTDLRARVEPLRGVTLGSGTRINHADNTGWLDTALLPAANPVRSDLRAYARQRVSWERGYAAWTATPLPSLSARLTGGILEEMFTGVSGEAVYHPAMARWSFGATLDRVWKRVPGEPLAVKGAARTAAALTLHIEPSGTSEWWAGASAGRYLGGDWGGTVELNRRIAGGLRLGAFATWTGGPRDGQSRIGGRLDLGLSLSFALQPAPRLPIEARAVAAVRTLGRDTGQRLDRPMPLQDDAHLSAAGRFTGDWNRLGE